MIEINNLTKGKIGGKFLKRLIGEVLEKEKSKKDVSVAFIVPKEMQELNRRYRKKNRETDILSFDYGDWGEIAVCLNEVKENAKMFKVKEGEELARVLIHGVLHLLGYDHEKTKKEEKIMEEKQNYYLAKFFNK